MDDTNITTLFLDIGGVLLSNGWGHDFRNQAAERFNLNKAEFEERHGILFVTYEEGRITLDEYLKYVIFYKKRDFTFEAFRDFMFSLTIPDNEMIDYIKSLKLEYGLKIVAVSNEARELNAHRIHTFKLNGIIDFFVSSCYVHIRKPDGDIFKMALDMAQVSPDQVVYVDDVQMFVDIAADLGIKSIRHINFSSTATTLAALGLQIKQGIKHV